jgi:hypothetical protein
MSLKHFITEEKEGIKDYQKEERKNPKKVYRKILPEEKKHLQWLKKEKVKKVLNKYKK